MSEPTLFDQPVAEALRDAGISRAINHANRETPGWPDIAYEFLKRYISGHQSFMTEDVRTASIGEILQAPNDRAWGGVIARARNEGLVQAIGTDKVKNPNAHCAFATVWGVKKY
jgi:hypothetical protein